MAQRDEESSESATQERPSWRLRVPGGLRRVGLLVLQVLGGVAGTFALLVLGGLLFLANLDHRWVKGSVEHALSDLVGTDVRYDHLSISPFDGVRAQSLVVATPLALRAHAPEMLRLEELIIPIEVGTLLSGDIVIPKVQGGALKVTVVVTDDGRNSFGELVQTEDDPEEAWPPLSRSLEALEDLALTVGPVELAPIVLRTVEVGVPLRQTDLRPLGIYSAGLVFGKESKGTVSLHPHARDVVVLSVLEPGQSNSISEAVLDPRVEVRLESNRDLAVSASAQLHEQSLFPELRPVRSLLRLESSASVDPDQGHTIVNIETLAVLDSMLDATARVVLQDAALPQDDDASGPQAVVSYPFATVRLDGHGVLDAPSLPWVLPWLSIDGLNGRFEVLGMEFEPAGVTAGSATLKGELKHARYEEGPLSVAVHDAVWAGELSVPEDPARTFGTLTFEATVDEVRAKEHHRFAARVGKLATALELRAVGVHDSGMWGLRGTGSLTGSTDRVSMRGGGLATVSKATVALNVDLANHHLEGVIPIKSVAIRRVGRDPIRMRDTQIDLVAREPIHWTMETGTPVVELGASVGRVSIGKRHFRAPRSSLEARRTEVDQYALDASLTADHVSWGKFRHEPESSMLLHAVVNTNKPALDATAALSVAGEAATELSLNASQVAGNTRYTLDLRGKEAGPLLGALLFGDGGHRSDELSFAFKSRGSFKGLVSKNRAGTLRLSGEPLRTTRGTHHSELSVERLDLVRAEIVHEVRGLEVQTSSDHQAPGHGTLQGGVFITEARYGRAGQPIVLHDYTHELRVAYAALHGAPSLAIETEGTLARLDQPFVAQYPIGDVSFGTKVDVDDAQVFAVREAYWRNPAGGTRLEARASYEGWRDAVRDTEVCSVGMIGCPEVASMYGREAATLTGTLEQDFSFWQSTERTKSDGSLVVPFTVESGDLNTYRVLATAQFRDLMLELPQYGLLIEDLDARIPVDQEFGTAPEFFVVPTKAANAMAQKRFFDLYPFTERDSFLTVGRVQLGGEVVGPIVANLHIQGSAIAMDQLHAAYRNGFVTGQFLADLNQDDPKVAFRGHITGVQVKDGDDVFDANLAMTFVPTTLIVEGKAQVVRVSKDHLYEIIDVLDPYHEDEDMNRVRLGLKFGYPKYVRINFDEGLMDAKIDLGGLAGAIRIDEIKGIPVTPFLEQYVQPYIERILSPSLMYEVAPAPPDGPQRVSQRLESPQ